MIQPIALISYSNQNGYLSFRCFLQLIQEIGNKNSIAFHFLKLG